MTAHANATRLTTLLRTAILDLYGDLAPGGPPMRYSSTPSPKYDGRIPSSPLFLLSLEDGGVRKYLLRSVSASATPNATRDRVFAALRAFDAVASLTTWRVMSCVRARIRFVVFQREVEKEKHKKETEGGKRLLVRGLGEKDKDRRDFTRVVHT